MPKLLKTLIHEAKEDMKHLHGTPFLILHTRRASSQKELSEMYLNDHLKNYPNQNQHISGNVPDDPIYHTHTILSSLHSEKMYDDDERGAVFDHSFESEPMNRALWDRHNEPEWSPGLPNNTVKLDRALSKFKTPSGGLTTFSGLQSDPLEAAKKHPENKLFLPAYTSTSISPVVSGDFARSIKTPQGTEVKHILKFKFPEGMKAGSYIGHMSMHPEEYEFLTRRGMSVHLHPEPEIIPYKSLKNPDAHVKIWTATPLGFHEN